WICVFQAEDGIRDRNVTGVQTCALPIWGRVSLPAEEPLGQGICYLSTEGDGELTLCLPFDLSRTEILDMELDSEGQLLVWTCEEIGRASCRGRGWREVG